MQIDIEKSNKPVYMNWVIFSSWIVSLYVVKVKKNTLKCKSAWYDSIPGRTLRCILCKIFLSLNILGTVFLDD